MTTPAFDRLWDEPEKPKQKPSTDALDALWGDERDHAQRLHDEYKTGNLKRRMDTNNATEAAEASEPTGTTWRELMTHPGDIPQAFARSMQATSANLSHGIPGAKAVQAFLRSKVKGQSYQEALSELENETGKIPETLRNVEKAVGAAPAALALPSSNILKAGVGAGSLAWASKMGEADPNVSLEQRTDEAPKDAALSAAFTMAIPATVSGADKVKRFLSTAKRVKDAPTIGAASMAKKGEIETTDDANFGAARTEAAALGGSSPDSHAILQNPLIKDLADDIRASMKLQKKPDDDASILFQLHRELSEDEGALIDRATNANRGKPLTSRQKGDVAAIKQMIREAVSRGTLPVAPSFEPAVAESAELRGEKSAMLQSAKHARRMMSGKVNLDKVDKQSPEEVQKWARSLDPEKAAEALTGALSEGKEAFQGFNALPYAGLGAGVGAAVGGPVGSAIGAASGGAGSIAQTAVKSAMRLNRIRPLIDELDRSAGNNVAQPLDTEGLRRIMPALTLQILEYLNRQKRLPDQP